MRKGDVAPIALLLALFSLSIAAGFVGVSDDDPSRALIAWDFAHQPSLDPTRSSWLPAHTYWVGALMAATRELCFTARASSALSAIAALYFLRRLTRRGRTLAVLIALAFPWSLWCAFAPALPELATVASLLAAAHFFARRRPLAASLLLSLACLHRYEAWFAAAGLSLAHLFLSREKKRSLALLWTLAPIAWLALNYFRSGDALDFIHRVTRYRAALSHDAASHEVLHRLLAPAIVGLGPSLWLAATAPASRRKALLLSGALATLAGVLVTDLRGGGATHHPDRALLPCVWMLAPLAAESLIRRWNARRVLSCALLACLAIAPNAWRATDVPRSVDASTVAIGRATNALSANGCVFLEGGRGDELWVRATLRDPRSVVSDRAFGAAIAARDPIERASACAVAIVHARETERRFLAASWVARARTGRWTLLSREASAAASAASSSRP